MLLQEMEQEQTRMRTEQDKLLRRIKKKTVRINNSKKDRGSILSLFNVDAWPTQTITWPLEVQLIFRAKDEQKTSEHRRLSNGNGHASGHDIQLLEAGQSEDSGPFSDASIQMSRGHYVSIKVLNKPPSKSPELTELEDWVRTQLCGYSVAEAEELGPDTTTDGKRGGPSTFEHVGGSLAPSNGTTSPRNQVTNCLKSTSFQHVKLVPMSDGERGAGFGYSRRNSEPLMPLRSDTNRDARVQLKNSDWMALVVAGAKNAAMSLVRDPREMPSERSTAGQSGVCTECSVGMNAQADGGQQEASEVKLNIVLRRNSNQKTWGFEWNEQGKRKRQERIVERLTKDSVAWRWNKEMEGSGQPDNCIKALDRLVSVNGKTIAQEMRTELAQEEVRLEFIRYLQHQEAAQDKAPVQIVITNAPQVSLVPVPPRDSDSQKGKFHDAFSAYLQACNPPGNEAVGVSDNLDEPCRGTDASPVEEDGECSKVQDSKEPLKPDMKEEVSSKADGEFGRDKPTEELEAPAAKQTPFGLVVQVLSLGAGTLRLSWRFDWTVAPTDFLEEPGLTRSFEVIRRRLGDVPEEVRTTCNQALLKLDIPVGFRYSFMVRAVIKDMAKQGDDVEWASEASQPATADLRRQSRPSGANSVGVPFTADAVATRGEGCHLLPGTAPLPRPARAVASSLWAFLLQGSQPLAAADLRPLETSGVIAEVSASDAPVPDPGRVAAEQSSSTLSPEKVPAVVMGPLADPLTTAKPLVVVGGNLDPAAEKRSIAERLRLRREGGLAALLEATTNLETQRSFSMDSDDEGSLMRLSTALSTLEKTAAFQSQRSREHFEQGFRQQ